MSYTRKTHLDKQMLAVEALEYMIETGTAGTDAIVTALEAMEVQQLAYLFDGVVLLKMEPVLGGGQLLTGNGGTDVTATIEAGSTYVVTASAAEFNLGFGALSSAANYAVTVPAGTTRVFTVPAAGGTTLYYRATASTTARLSKMRNT